MMRTAFCSNRLLNTYFVESTAPPSRCDVNILKKCIFEECSYRPLLRKWERFGFKINQFEFRYAFRLFLLNAGGGRLLQDTMRKCENTARGFWEILGLILNHLGVNSFLMIFPSTPFFFARGWAEHVEIHAWFCKPFAWHNSSPRKHKGMFTIECAAGG